MVRTPSSDTAAHSTQALLEGERTVLRPANLGFTVDELKRRYLWSKDDDLQYWSGAIPTARTFEEFQQILPERDWPRDGKRRSYAILDQSGELIGMVSCYSIEWTSRTGELGVYIGEPNLWSRGLGTDAILTLLRHLFLDLGFRRVYLNTYASNTRALRSYSKVGFERTGTRRRFRPSVGYYREIRMLIDREGYLARHPLDGRETPGAAGIAKSAAPSPASSH